MMLNFLATLEFIGNQKYPVLLWIRCFSEMQQEEMRIWLKTGSSLTQLLCNSSLVISDCSKESWWIFILNGHI